MILALNSRHRESGVPSFPRKSVSR